MATKATRKNNDSTANLGFEAKLWLAADKLRNNMDAAEYKHVVLGLIFLKYISDTLGIILCADKDATMVRYSVLSESQQLFASKYRLILPSEEELQSELERRHVLDWPPPEEGNPT